jgi:hypothetical protein
VLTDRRGFRYVVHDLTRCCRLTRSRRSTTRVCAVELPAVPVPAVSFRPARIRRQFVSAADDAAGSQPETSLSRPVFPSRAEHGRRKLPSPRDGRPLRRSESRNSPVASAHSRDHRTPAEPVGIRRLSDGARPECINSLIGGCDRRYWLQRARVITFRRIRESGDPEVCAGLREMLGGAVRAGRGGRGPSTQW